MVLRLYVHHDNGYRLLGAGEAVFRRVQGINVVGLAHDCFIEHTKQPRSKFGHLHQLAGKSCHSGNNELCGDRIFFPDRHLCVQLGVHRTGSTWGLHMPCLQPCHSYLQAIYRKIQETHRNYHSRKLGGKQLNQGTFTLMKFILSLTSK